MGNLAPNISRHEVACNCGCGFDSADIDTVQVLQKCCDHIASSLGVARVILNINSWCRCYEHNTCVGGSDDSQHLYARAVDFWMEWIEVTADKSISRKVDPDLVYAYLNTKYKDRYGLGQYKTFTHLDTKTGPPRRWVG